MTKRTTGSTASRYSTIPVRVSEEAFERFVLPCLSMPKRGPKGKIGHFKLFNYILRVLYTGMQWKELPIGKGPDGKPEIHYTVIYKRCACLSDDGSLSSFFVVSVKHLNDVGELDLSVLHGDGTNTVAKRAETVLAIPDTSVSWVRRSLPSSRRTPTSSRRSRWLQ